MSFCPATGQYFSAACPATGQSPAYGPRGCAFLGMAQSSSQTLYGAPKGPNALQKLSDTERKTLCEVLLPTAPPKEKTKNMPNADSLNPPEVDVLAVALGAPARRVLERADMLGPLTGWRDGFLSTQHGLCPPDPNAAPAALAMSPGRVWSDICARMPGLIARGRVREAILELPLVDGSPETIPDAALWAAVVCLGILCSIWRYEERNDGHEGIVKGARKDMFTNIHGEPDEEPETRGIPRNIVIPFRQICTRLGRPLPYLSQSDVSLHNYKIRDPTSIYPYVARIENMDLRWPIFNDRGEAMFLLCMAEVHGLFQTGPDIIASCQERVMFKDNDGLLRELVRLKEVIDQLSYVFHKISVNPHSGENFANPTFWGQGYAKFSAPLSKRLPALSGLFLPIFQCMDAFLARTNFKSFLGIESIHLRAWMPLNIRAFLAAIENHFPVVPYVKASGDPRLLGVLDAIVESYAGEKGFMGTHRYKVYGFLEVVAKTGRVETNGNAGATDTAGRPWQEVHRTLAESMKERLEPYRSEGSLDVAPQDIRGSYDECRFWAKIIDRSSIDDDPHRTTGKVTFDLRNVGLTSIPGDRLAVMPLNAWSDVEKIVGALGLMDYLDARIDLNIPTAAKWKRYARHEADVSKRDPNTASITVRDILRKGKIAPLTKDMVLAVHSLVRVSSAATLRVLGSDAWPVHGSLGDLLVAVLNDVNDEVWDQAFSLSDLSWLPGLISPEVPRTYSISSFSFDLLPETLDLTVARAEHEVSPLLILDGKKATRPGVCSGFLNPDPTLNHEPTHPLTRGDQTDDVVLVGISRPLNFQLPISPAAPVAMFAGGSGIAPFRGFWQARVGSGGIGRNLLFLGVQSRQKFLYKHELRNYVQSGQLELHVAFSRDTNGLVYDPISRDLVEKTMEPRYIDSTILDQGPTVCDIVTSTKLGGLGGYIYICGSVSLYETVISGIRQALYKYRAVTKEGADELLAQAFAERRCMLDVFMTPRAMSENEPYIPLSELSKHTGHRQGSKMWIGVHGSVYDVTEFLPIHPGGSLIVSASAGLDASLTFDEVAHTSNPEVMSLLGKYFIGYLTPKPTFQLSELSDLYDSWVDYLRTCVEALTTLSFEVDTLMEDSKLWFSGGMISTHALRKMYQLQSRLLTKTGFPILFGTKIQELFLKLSFNIANNDDDSLLPDIVGIITQATSGPAAIKARREIAEIGEFVTNSATSAPSFERGLIDYTRNVCELDVRFLEQVREEICVGYDSFMSVANVLQSYQSSDSESIKERQALHRISTVLVGCLERIADRVTGFYEDLAQQSLYHPEREANPARTRWKFVQRRVKDGSFFSLTREAVSLSLDQPIRAEKSLMDNRGRNKRQSVTFDQVLSQAISSVAKVGNAQRTPYSKGRTVSRKPSSTFNSIAEDDDTPTPPRPRRLADAHTERARGGNATTSHEDALDVRAASHLSQFMTRKMKEIRRISKAGNNLSLEHAMQVYGKPGNGGPHSPDDISPTRSMPPVPNVPQEYRDHRRAPSRKASMDRMIDNTARLFNGSSSRYGGSSGSSVSGSEYASDTRYHRVHEGSDHGSRSGSPRPGSESPYRTARASPTSGPPPPSSYPSRYRAGSNTNTNTFSVNGDHNDGASDAGTVRSARARPIANAMHSATFSRKLSVYRSESGRSSDSPGPSPAGPPVPPKTQSHW
ncbi:hypothetical protein AX16_005035 [Volvariella volvacea WC 439]|nr:hypothetical protein AX16_005035 [Volvariella volvacea WC 439]